MIKIYLMSIIIWFIVLVCTASLLGKKVEENGWLDGLHAGPTGWLQTVKICAIPVIRLLVWAVMLYMASETKEHYEEIKRNIENDR